VSKGVKTVSGPVLTQLDLLMRVGKSIVLYTYPKFVVLGFGVRDPTPMYVRTYILHFLNHKQILMTKIGACTHILFFHSYAIQYNT